MNFKTSPKLIHLLREEIRRIVEASSYNDPVLIAYRAKRDQRAKELTNKSKNKTRPLYGKDRIKAEDLLWNISQDLKDLYSDRRRLYVDMESEAGEMGIDAFEKAGLHNIYGKKLDSVEKQIQDLITKRSNLELKLAEGNIKKSQLESILRGLIKEELTKYK
jgi:hypothetical protein